MIDEQKSLHLKREKRLKQNEQGLGNLRGNIKKSKICVIQVPEEEEREKRLGKVSEYILGKNSPNLVKN